MRKFLPLSIVLTTALSGLTGCFSSTHLVQKTQAPDLFKTATVEQLQKEVSDRDKAIDTLNASVLITATTGGGRTGSVTEYTSFRGYIFVRKPRDLRVILQLPVLGSEAMDMVSNGENFTLVIPPRHKAIVGTNVVTKPSANGLENLRPTVFFDSLLVPGVGADDFVTLTESTRVMQPETKHHAAIEEPDYDLTVMKKKPGSPSVLQRLRTIHINRINMLPFQQDIYDDAGQIVTQALYDKYQAGGEGAGAEQFPMLITIRRPQDQYSLKVEVTKLALNTKFDNDQFELTIPQGVTVQKME